MRQGSIHQAELDLVRAALSREPRALDELGQRLQCVPRILAHVNARQGNALDAQDLPDLVQSCLTVIWQKLPQFAGRSELETWAYRICFLEFQNAARRSRRQRERMERQESVEGKAGEVQSDPAQSPHSAMERQELFESLSRLEDPARTILRLKHYDELTFDEIGRRLSITPSKAKARYYEGLKRLNHLLRQSWGESN